MRLARATPILLAIALAGGCDDDSSQPFQPTGHDSHAVAAIQVEAPVASLEMGDVVQLTASVTCEHGIALDRAVAWTTTDLAVATIDNTGQLSSLRPGEIEVRATAGGVTDGLPLAVTGVFVGPEGRTIVSPDGMVTLDIPPGALGSTVEFIGLPAAGADMPNDPGYVPGTAYECLPHGLQFQERVQLRIRFDPDRVPQGYQVAQLQIRHRERTQNQWRQAIQNQVLIDENTVLAEIESLSYFAVVGTPAGSAQAGVDAIRITGLDDPNLDVGDVVYLTAAVYDGSGTRRPEWVASWRSEDPAVATVDQAGRVEAVGAGATNIDASYGGLTRGVTVNVSGTPGGGGKPPGHTAGNNLSYPVIFTEGIGITGDVVTSDAGLRPTPAEGIVVDALPFFYSGNVPDYGAYYEQAGTNVWQADWLDGSAAGAQSATVYWGDNLTHHAWNTHSMIRVEHVLEAGAGTMLEGFNMYPLYGTGPDEMQGTDGTTGFFVPTLYSVMPRLTIEKIDAEGGSPVYTAFDGAIHEGIGLDGPGYYTAEVNVAGKIIYGYNFMIRNLTLPPNETKYGWWRITFSLDAQGSVGGATVFRNVGLAALGGLDPASTFAPQIDPATNRTWIDVYVDSASGGGGGGHNP